jgi:hypothetical protein
MKPRRGLLRADAARTLHWPGGAVYLDVDLETLNDLQIAQRYVVYPGLERIPLRHGAQAIGLRELAALLAHD